MNNLYLFLYFFAYHLVTSGVPPVVRVPPVENRCTIMQYTCKWAYLEVSGFKYPSPIESVNVIKVRNAPKCTYNQYIVLYCIFVYSKTWVTISLCNTFMQKVRVETSYRNESNCYYVPRNIRREIKFLLS